MPSIYEDANRLQQLATRIPVEKIQEVGEELVAAIREAADVMGGGHAYDTVMAMLAAAEDAQQELMSVASGARQTLEETGAYHLGN